MCNIYVIIYVYTYEVYVYTYIRIYFLLFKILFRNISISAPILVKENADLWNLDRLHEIDTYTNIYMQ